VSLRPSRLSIASTKSDASESSSRYFWMDHPRRHRRQPAILPEFLCGANGVEMLRLGCCLVSERGVNILAQVHDVLMVESPADAIDEIVARTQEAMAEASAIVLDGFWLRSDAKIARRIGTWMNVGESFGAGFRRCSRTRANFHSVGAAIGTDRTRVPFTIRPMRLPENSV
jgi:hypothetical protein